MPGCEAWVVQVPALSSVADEPDTEHTAGVSEVKVTARPDVDVAVRVTLEPCSAGLDRGLKVIVCDAAVTFVDAGTGVAAP